MSASMIFRGKEYRVKVGMTIRDALFKIDIQPDTVLITRDGELITDDEILREEDEIKLIAVISGGQSMDPISN
jgi:sulfur carrier protein ThiS